MTDRQRREKGAGTLKEVRPGVWRVRVYVGQTIDGTPRQVSQTVHGTRREAQSALTKLANKADQRQLNLAAPMTVKRFLEDWLVFLKGRGLAVGTIESRESYIKHHLVPSLGKYRLNKLNGRNIDAAYTEALEDGIKPGTVRLMHSILTAALNQAVRWGLIPTNPAKDASAPRPARGDAPALPVEQVQQLMAEAQKTDPELAMGIVLAAITGARRGELCGLRWSDVDWEGQRLTVQRGIVQTHGGYVIGPPKGGRTRLVAIGPVGMAALSRYWEFARDRAEAAGAEPDPEGWLLSEDGGHTWFTPGQLASRLRKLTARLGMKVHLHEFRHFAATQLVGAGVDIKTAADRLGHTPEVMLRTYAHALPARDRAAADELEGVVFAPVAAIGPSSETASEDVVDAEIV